MNNNKLKLRRRTITSLVVMVLGGWSYAANAQSQDSYSESFGQLVADFSRIRSLAYAQVADLKALYAKSKQGLTKAENAYKKAKSAADSWIDVARASVANSNGKVDAKALESPTRYLQKQLNELVDLAQSARATMSPNERTKNPALISAVAALIASIAEAGTKAFESWSKANEKERTSVREELERLRWLRFSDI